jgi:uncharacterized protein
MSDFDERTQQQLQYYVYLLVDPRDKKPFYVGKGIGNRVFAHLEAALKEESKDSLKYDVIRELNSLNMKPDHLIVRHGLSEGTAFELEAALIDVLQFMKYKRTNIAGGHNSVEKGLMTSDEIIRLYNAEKLDRTTEDCIVININRKYHRGFNSENIYEATSKYWAISKSKADKLKYVLSEYKGLIVEVFEVDEWYPVQVPYNPGSKREGKLRTRYGFHGKVAPPEIRDRYINRSVAHHKKRGYASPILYLG